MNKTTGIIALLGAAAVATGAFIVHKKGKLKYLKSIGKRGGHRGRIKGEGYRGGDYIGKGRDYKGKANGHKY